MQLDRDVTLCVYNWPGKLVNYLQKYSLVLVELSRKGIILADSTYKTEI